MATFGRMARPSATWLLGVAAAVALVAVGLPLWRPLLLAAVLAGALSQLHARLVVAVGGRRSLSAALVTVGVVILLIGPLGLIGAVVVKEALGAISFVTRTLEQQGLAGLLSGLV